MSKQIEAAHDRIPSYEESIATSPPPPTSTNTTFSQKISPRQSIQQRTRQERLRRVAALVANHVEPAITNHLEDGTTKMLVLLLPTDSFPDGSHTSVSTASITSPTLSLPTTLLNLRSSLQQGEREDDYKSSFLNQRVVVHDLTTALHQSMLNPEALYSEFNHSLPRPRRRFPQQRRSLLASLANHGFNGNSASLLQTMILRARQEHGTWGGAAMRTPPRHRLRSPQTR